MSETDEENSAPPCIRTIRDRTFFVPYYQRGYRWEKKQVEQLLKDIKENTDGTRKYSLQPIVVAQQKMAEGMQRWELIDGQQRLTTLNLILRALGEEQIPILYARHQVVINEPSCSSDLEINKYLGNGITCPEDWKNIKQNELNIDTVDNHHIVDAWLAINTWLGELSPSVPSIKLAILDRTTVIWHEVDSEDSPSEFLRFNTGKIHLSPCELLKARFLATYEPAMIHRSPSEIASEWDQMESAFHEAEFWSFLHPTKSASEAPNRIALLFELLAPSNEYDLAGRCYLDKFPEPTQVPEIEEIWRELRRCFLTLQEWFSDREICHKIGFLRWSRLGKDVDLRDLWRHFQQGRSAFCAWLSGQIKDILTPTSSPNRWQSASYDKDKDYLYNLLFWFNIDTLPPDTYYSFARHASVGTWSLEHIHAQSSPAEANRKQFEDWKTGCTTLLNHLKKKRTDLNPLNQSATTIKIDELLGQISGLTMKDDSDPETLKTIKRLDDDLKTMLPNLIGEDLNKAWNLALLGSRENSSLSNDFFHQKRGKILEFEKCAEHFVPPATVRVFLKGYSSEPDDLMLWGPRDRDAYKKRICEVLEFTTKKGTPIHE